jgi:arabinan endo-1,5-alpha-L-arabinosidase
LDGWPVAGENVKDGTYQIRSQRTGTILQVPAGTNGTSVQTARYLSRDHQKWNIAAAGEGFYKILNNANGLALQSVGADVGIAPFTGAEEQLWKLDQVTDGSYRIAAKGSHFALTAFVNARPETSIGLRSSNGDDVQHWVITVP